MTSRMTRSRALVLAGTFAAAAFVGCSTPPGGAASGSSTATGQGTGAAADPAATSPASPTTSAGPSLFQQAIDANRPATTAALDASAHGDGTKWQAAAAGTVLDEELFEAVAQRVRVKQDPKAGPPTVVHWQSAGQLWADTSANPQRVVGLNQRELPNPAAGSPSTAHLVLAFQRDGTDGPWRLSFRSDLSSPDLPTPADRPLTEADRAAGEHAASAVATYYTLGVAPTGLTPGSAESVVKEMTKPDNLKAAKSLSCALPSTPDPAYAESTCPSPRGRSAS